MDYENRTAVITGAASGIGRGLAVELARRGAHVAISDVARAGLDETAELCARHGAVVRAYDLDVADRAAVVEHAERVRADFGAAHLVVNNAGVALGATVEEMTWEDYDWLMGVNLDGVVNGTKAFLPLLVDSGTAREKAHVVNVSSVFGFIGVPTQSAYNAAKFAVRGFTEALRQELIIARRPVSAHCVHPGGVRTNIAANARSAIPLDIDPKDFQKIARTSPEGAARIILRGVDRDAARILVGPDAVVFDAIPRLLGARYEGIAAHGARLLGPRFGFDLSGRN